MKMWSAVSCALAASYGILSACGSGGLVGGSCRDGYAACGQSCVDLASDPQNCGACGRSCEAGAACVERSCVTEGPRPDPSQGGSMIAGGGSAGGPQSRAGQGGVSENGGEGANASDAGAAGSEAVCSEPYRTPLHCGDCDTSCRGQTPLCAADGVGSYRCVATCGDGQEPCGGQCVDPLTYNSDPENCGRCGEACPTGICQSASCVGAAYGNVVLMCMNFAQTSQSSVPTTLLGNAVFLPPRRDVSVLAFTEGAEPSAVSKVNQVIGWAAEARARRVTISEARTESDVTRQLNVGDFPVFLIHDLSRAVAGEPARLGAAWRVSGVLPSFESAGGVVVVLDSGTGTREMSQLMRAAALLDVTGEHDITGTPLWNQAPFDTIGANLLSPFLGTARTCAFDTLVAPSFETLFVLTDQKSGGAPVVVHEVISP